MGFGEWGTCVQRTVAGRKSLVSFVETVKGGPGVSQSILGFSVGALICCRLFELIRN